MRRDLPEPDSCRKEVTTNTPTSSVAHRFARRDGVLNTHHKGALVSGPLASRCPIKSAADRRN
jgi:hypothetical protein